MLDWEGLCECYEFTKASITGCNALIASEGNQGHSTCKGAPVGTGAPGRKACAA